MFVNCPFNILQSCHQLLNIFASAETLENAFKISLKLLRYILLGNAGILTHKTNIRFILDMNENKDIYFWKSYNDDTE